MSRFNDLSAELQAEYAKLDVLKARELRDRLNTDPSSTPNERLEAELDLRAAQERYSDWVS